MREIFIVWKKELIDNFRDRRTLMTALLMPVILMPVILIGTFKLQEYQVKQTEEKTAVIGIASLTEAPTLVDFLSQQPKIELKEIAPETYAQEIDNGTIGAYLAIPADFEMQLASDESPVVTVYSKSSNLDSATAGQKVQTTLAIFSQQIGTGRLMAQGIDPSIIQGVAITPEDISTAEERGGFFIGLLLPMFIVIFAIVGGMYVAIDVSAGEKERKTLEALLLAPLSRFRIVMGKYLAVTTMASMTIILSLVSMSIAFALYTPDLGMGTLTIDLSPAAIAIMLVIGIILAVMFSGLLLSVAIFAKSYKEAQNYISPFYILAVLPVGIANSLPSFKPSLAFFAVPGMNAVFVIKEVLLGTYDWTHIGITVATLVVFAGLGIVVASKIYSKVGILFRD